MSSTCASVSLKDICHSSWGWYLSTLMVLGVLHWCFCIWSGKQPSPPKSLVITFRWYILFSDLVWIHPLHIPCSFCRKIVNFFIFSDFYHSPGWLLKNSLLFCTRLYFSSSVWLPPCLQDCPVFLKTVRLPKFTLILHTWEYTQGAVNSIEVGVGWVLRALGAPAGPERRILLWGFPRGLCRNFLLKSWAQSARTASILYPLTFLMTFRIISLPPVMRCGPRTLGAIREKRVSSCLPQNWGAGHWQISTLSPKEKGPTG